MQVLRAELSNLASERKKEEKGVSLLPPALQSFYSQLASPQTQTQLQTQLSNDEVERLMSLLTLKVRGSDAAVLDSYTQFMRRAANVLQLDVSGKVVIPTHIEKRTLLKSPHINKKHRVQYELRTHARMLQVRELTGDTADIFLEYIQRNLPEGVSMSVEQTELEPIPEYITDILQD